MQCLIKFTHVVYLIFLAKYTAEAGLFTHKSERMKLPFPELAKYDGYNTQTHTVTTDDGYILNLFRIPVSKKCNISSGIPILFMHGLYLSGDDCIVPGPRNAHCYIYAGNCYDVWVGNVRGNRYGRNHTTLNPDIDTEFWDFDLDEYANYDLPATIDYVLNKTGQSQLAYIGHAQSAAMLWILCSEKPDYNEKIKVGFCMSPTAGIGNSTFIVIAIEGLVAPALTQASEAGFNTEILKYGGIEQKAVEEICSALVFSYQLCSAAYFGLFGYNAYQITEEVLPVVVGHVPAGISVKAFARWGQIRNKGFRHYDYGSSKNLAYYGTKTPPLYDLRKVTAAIVMIASEGDNVGTVEDMNIIVSQLSNVQTFILPEKRFGHLDFIYGKDIKNYVTPIILNYLSNNSAQ